MALAEGHSQVLARGHFHPAAIPADRAPTQWVGVLSRGTVVALDDTKGVMSMPIYEYRCEDCQAQSSIRFSSFAQAATASAVCTVCGSARLVRLISRCAITRTSTPATTPQARPSGTGTPHGNDPQSLAQRMRMAARGRDMGDDFREVAARLEKGEQAATIEASLRRRVGETMQGPLT
jgi:putative FmdB family regulatory protein